MLWFAAGRTLAMGSRSLTTPLLQLFTHRVNILNFQYQISNISRLILLFDTKLSPANSNTTRLRKAYAQRQLRPMQ